MKQNLLHFLLFLIFSLTIFSCEKDKNIDSIIGKWEVISVYKDSIIVPKNIEIKYNLEFRNDTNVMIALDVNDCWGNYSIILENNINFSDFGCTKICCDSDYALKLINIIQESSKFEISDDILSLQNIGEVKLKWIDE